MICQELMGKNEGVGGAGDEKPGWSWEGVNGGKEFCGQRD